MNYHLIALIFIIIILILLSTQLWILYKAFNKNKEQYIIADNNHFNLQSEHYQLINHYIEINRKYIRAFALVKNLQRINLELKYQNNSDPAIFVPRNYYPANYYHPYHSGSQITHLTAIEQYHQSIRDQQNINKSRIHYSQQSNNQQSKPTNNNNNKSNNQKSKPSSNNNNPSIKKNQ